MNLDRQVQIHRRALELRTYGHAYSEIISQLFYEYEVRIPKSTISYWGRGLHGPLGRAHTFTPSPTPDLAYIIGGGKRRRLPEHKIRTVQYRIRLQSIDLEFVEEFNRCLSKVLNSSKHALWKGAGRKETHVEASFLLHHFLQSPFEELKPFIEHCAECSAAFLRGFFDSEGCVDKSGSITASNCDIDLLKYVQYLLAKCFSIDTTGPHLQSRKGSLMTRRGRTYSRNSD